VTPWDFLLAICIVLGVYVMARAQGESRGFIRGYQAHADFVRMLRETPIAKPRDPGSKPPTRPV
jgi:hypothetical protein